MGPHQSACNSISCRRQLLKWGTRLTNGRPVFSPTIELALRDVRGVGGRNINPPKTERAADSGVSSSPPGWSLITVLVFFVDESRDRRGLSLHDKKVPVGGPVLPALYKCALHQHVRR